jgi:hypothetical protein
MSPPYLIADAFRLVALRLEQAIESGRRSKQIDAEDLRETLLAIADILDSPAPTACPACGERRQDELVVKPTGMVACQTCGGEFAKA